jgi:hypothetical protein
MMDSKKAAAVQTLIKALEEITGKRIADMNKPMAMQVDMIEPVDGEEEGKVHEDSESSDMENCEDGELSLEEKRKKLKGNPVIESMTKNMFK